jgi:hypothetical protein
MRRRFRLKRPSVTTLAVVFIAAVATAAAGTGHVELVRHFIRHF